MTTPSAAVDIDVWRVRLDEPLPGGAWAALSDAERERAERMRSAAWRHDFVLAHYATRVILARYSGTDPAALEFQRGAHGKPTAPGHAEFSLSHTDGLALVAVSAAEVGVDVETTAQTSLADGLIPRCLTAGERAAVERAADNGTTTAFLRYWTAKESYLKGLGIGLNEPLRNVEIRWNADTDADANSDASANSDTTASARVARGGATDRDWVLRAVNAGPDHVAAVAVRTPRPGTRASVRYLDFTSSRS
jgi:4'-phosphopantetheinyl transferase